MNVRHLTDEREGRGSGDVLAFGLRVVSRRPALWWPALRALVAFAPTGWWRRPPFLPVPDARYWRFRMETAYGDELSTPGANELVDALRWSRRARARRR